VPHVCIYKDKKGYFFFLPEDLLKMPMTAKNRPKGEAGKTSTRLCKTCGRMYMAKPWIRECNVCRGIPDEDDEYGVKITRKKQGRKCPKCGGDLWTGQYVCSDCKSKHKTMTDGYLDAEYAYGSLNL